MTRKDANGKQVIAPIKLCFYLGRNVSAVFALQKSIPPNTEGTKTFHLGKCNAGGTIKRPSSGSFYLLFYLRSCPNLFYFSIRGTSHSICAGDVDGGERGSFLFALQLPAGLLQTVVATA